MGGGTPLFEANRLGFDVAEGDVNPMASWIVRQSLTPLAPELIEKEGERIASLVERAVGELYTTSCLVCGDAAPVKYFPVGQNHRLLRLLATERPLPRLPSRRSGAPSSPRCRVPRLWRTRGVRGCADPRVTGGLYRVRHGDPRRRHGVAWQRSLLGLRSYAHLPATSGWTTAAPAEYNCPECYAGQQGRQFKAPDESDLRRVERAASMFAEIEHELPIPDDLIPAGDESNRLHRWGYRRYREMFSERQLLGLGLLLGTIRDQTDGAVRDALLTVFSDFLRYQNMLCRYDTAALKCQDIFSVHGFPVGLIQCENNLLGIRGVGGGAFRHFVLKYARAKAYCAAPFEVARRGRRNVRVPIAAETIAADLDGDGSTTKSARLYCGSSQAAWLAPGSLDGVFTDPPYFDNVQYMRGTSGDRTPVTVTRCRNSSGMRWRMPSRRSWLAATSPTARRDGRSGSRDSSRRRTSSYRPSSRRP